MNRNVWCPFFSLILLCLGCDDIKSKLIEARNNDSVDKYLKLAGDVSLSNIERNKHNQKAFSFIDLKRNDTVVRYYLCQAAINFTDVGNGKEYYKVSNIHFKKSKERSDTLNLARFYRYRAGHNRRINKVYDSAFYYFLKAEKLYKKTNDKDALAVIYFNKGLVQYSQDDYLGAELSIQQALNQIKYNKPKRFNYQILSQLGIIQDNLHNYDEAIKIHKKTLKLAIDLQLSPEQYQYNFINTSLNNIGNVYKEQKNYKKAIYYFEKALRNKKDFRHDPLIFAYLYNNLGYCKMQLNNYNQLPYLFEKAVKIYDSLDLPSESAIGNMYLSKYYLRKNDIVKAKIFSEKALVMAKESKAPYYYLITLSYAGFIDKNKAPIYIKRYHEISDSMQFEQRKARNQFYKIQLETNEITQEKETAIKQKWIISSMITGVLLIVILLFVIYRQRTKQKELAFLQEQQKANENIYQLMLGQQEKVEEARQIEKKRISLELHDGIMNQLASTRMNLFVLSKQNDMQTIANCLDYINDIRNIENEIRSLSHELNKEVFTDKDNFKMLLEQFVEMQNKHSKTQYQLHIEENVNWELLTSEIKMHLYRIIQEATSNINKYADAGSATFHFSMDNNNIYISLADNGIGFASKRARDGIGLKNIEQRINLLKGKLNITSKINKGTTLYFSLPLKK